MSEKKKYKPTVGEWFIWAYVFWPVWFIPAGIIYMWIDQPLCRPW